MQFGCKKDEVSALELEFQQLDGHKSGFSDNDEDPSDVDALLVDGGRPEVHRILPLCPLTFLPSLAHIVSLFLKSEFFYLSFFI